jgi:subtilase family serine protease
MFEPQQGRLPAMRTLALLVAGSTLAAACTSEAPHDLQTLTSALDRDGNIRALVNWHRSHYEFDQLPVPGRGQLIAIIGSDTSPTLRADFATFCRALGLPVRPDSLTLKYVRFVDAAPGYHVLDDAEVAALEADPNAYGQGDKDNHLTAESAFALAPEARIEVVIVQKVATANSIQSILAGLKFAVDSGATQVSMSFIAAENAKDVELDQYFAAHPTVAFVASSGDWGSGTGSPAA